MRKYRWIGAFALCAAAAFAQDNVKWQQELPLLDCDGIPCIDAQIGAQRVKLAIDTGNDSSVLDASIASKIHLQAPAQTAGKSSMYRTHLDSISVGTATLERVPVLVADLSTWIAQHHMPAVDGTLAYTAFPDRVLQLDFVHHRLRMSAAGENGECRRSDCDNFSLINFNPSGPPVIVAQGFTINGHTLMSQIDTMFTGSLVIYSSAISKEGLAEQAQSTKEREFDFTDGGVKMTQGSADSESFHQTQLPSRNVYFPTPAVHQPGDRFDATVGLELLQNAILTLDFKNKTIRIQQA